MSAELGYMPAPNLVSNEYLEIIQIIDNKFDAIHQRIRHLENCFHILGSYQKCNDIEDNLIHGLQRRICDLEERLCQVVDLQHTRQN